MVDTVGFGFATTPMAAMLGTQMQTQMQIRMQKEMFLHKCIILLHACVVQIYQSR